jgi:hypothetical protein
VPAQVYDLGLTEAEAAEVQSWESVSFHSLWMDAYPPHVISSTSLNMP